MKKHEKNLAKKIIRSNIIDFRAYKQYKILVNLPLKFYIKSKTV